MQLNELVNIIENCHKCPLSATRNNVVVHDGNSQAKLLLIGEAPGKQEDLEGKPFVGQSGKLLNQLLEQVAINRQEHCYIANIIKCRPPDNRVPHKQEVQQCIKYLHQQIQLINPEIIICLGSTAIKHVLGWKKFKITEIHGKWIDLNNIPDISSEYKDIYKNKLLMPIYHPSYLLRNRSTKINSPQWQVLQALQLVKEKIL